MAGVRGDGLFARIDVAGGVVQKDRVSAPLGEVGVDRADEEGERAGRTRVSADPRVAQIIEVVGFPHRGAPKIEQVVLMKGDLDGRRTGFDQSLAEGEGEPGELGLGDRRLHGKLALAHGPVIRLCGEEDHGVEALQGGVT